MDNFCRKKNQTEIDFPTQNPLIVFLHLSTIFFQTNFLKNVVNIPWKYFSMFENQLILLKNLEHIESGKISFKKKTVT